MLTIVGIINVDPVDGHAEPGQTVTLGCEILRRTRRAARSWRTSMQKAGSGGSRPPAPAVAAEWQPKLHPESWQRMLEVVEPPLIVDSARKHGIADEDVLHAFQQPRSL